MVTAERLRELFHYSKRTGIFTHRISGRSSRQKGRVRIRIDGKNYIASRLAWLYVTGKWPEGLVDHEDRDFTNNRWKNLRDLTPSGNQQNNGGKGYTLKRGKYQAQIKYDGKSVFLGKFDTEEAARKAYLKAKKEYHR